MKSPLAIKMARVMGQIAHAPELRNDVHRYDQLCLPDVAASIRSKLAEQGVAIFASIAEHTTRAAIDERGKLYHAYVTMELTFIDGETGDQRTSTWVGEGTDRGDKSYYKAYRQAYDQAVLHTFLIPQGGS